VAASYGISISSSLLRYLASDWVNEIDDLAVWALGTSPRDVES
jgi:hypothetical protein